MAGKARTASSLDDIMDQMSDFVADMKLQMSAIQGEKTLVQLTQDFVNAVEWSEWWIRAILGFHMTLFLLECVFSRSLVVQITVFLVAAAIVFLAEPLNGLGADYWEEFATQPYFDKRGAFYSGVVSLPLVFVMLVALVNLIRMTVADMVRLKRRQLRGQHVKEE